MTASTGHADSDNRADMDPEMLDLDRSGENLADAYFGFRSVWAVLYVLATIGATGYVTYILYGDWCGKGMSPLVNVGFTLPLIIAIYQSPRACWSVGVIMALSVLALATADHFCPVFAVLKRSDIASMAFYSVMSMIIVLLVYNVLGKATPFRIVRCNFNEAALTKSKWYGSSAVDTKFVKARLQECKARHAQFSRCDFQEANLSKAQIVTSNVSASRFDGSISEGLLIVESYIFDCSFENANLQGAKFYGRSITRTSFRGSNLRNATFKRIKFDDVDFTGAVANAKTIWPAGFDPAARGVIIVD